MTEEEKKTIKQEKHPGRVDQGHKLAAFMKKRKEEILSNKERSSVQSTEQSTVQSKEQSKEQSTEQSSIRSTVQSTEQSSVQPTAQSNDTYNLWCWYACGSYHRCLCIFYVQQEGS